MKTNDAHMADYVRKLVNKVRVSPGYYIVHTPKGTYEVNNCPASREDVKAGFPSGPRWMITYPGEYTADGECRTLREALEQIESDIAWELLNRGISSEELAVSEDFRNRHAADSPWNPVCTCGCLGHIALVGKYLCNECASTMDSVDHGVRFVVAEHGSFFSVWDTKNCMIVHVSGSRYACRFVIDCLSDGSMVLNHLGVAVASGKDSK